jgi:hypothetical protein
MFVTGGSHHRHGDWENHIVIIEAINNNTITTFIAIVDCIENDMGKFEVSSLAQLQKNSCNRGNTNMILCLEENETFKEIEAFLEGQEIN